MSDNVSARRDKDESEAGSIAILGVSAAAAGALYVALGWLQEAAGLGAGMVTGFALAASPR